MKSDTERHHASAHGGIARATILTLQDVMHALHHNQTHSGPFCTLAGCAVAGIEWSNYHLHISLHSPCLLAEPADPAENPSCWLLLHAPELPDQMPEAAVHLQEGMGPGPRPTC